MKDSIIKAATVMSKERIRRDGAVLSDEEITATQKRFGLSDEESAEADEVADEWTDDYFRDLPERIATLEDSQTEPVDPHGPWGAP